MTAAPLCTRTTSSLSIHLSVNVGCFCVLAIVNSASLNTGVHVSFWITFGLGLCPGVDLLDQWPWSKATPSLCRPSHLHRRPLTPSALSPTGACDWLSTPASSLPRGPPIQAHLLPFTLTQWRPPNISGPGLLEPYSVNDDVPRNSLKLVSVPESHSFTHDFTKIYWARAHFKV